MKASELIKRLQELMAEYGDQLITNIDGEVSSHVIALDDDGKTCKTNNNENPAVEFYIH